MTIDRDPVRSGTELRDEAARWFAVMRGPEAETSRAAFGAWLAKDEAHRAAYNRIAETFSLGKRLKADPADTPPGPAARSRRRRPTPSLIFALAAAAALLTLALQQLPAIGGQNSPAAIAQRHRADPAQAARLATGVSEIRTFPLPDGSKVTLDSSSILLVSYSDTARTLRLVHGRGRFAVAHEHRPFAVLAGRGRVTARGTLFDVVLTGSGEAIVHLLHGAVDVDLQVSSPDPVRTVGIQRMLPGQMLRIGDNGISAPGIAPLNQDRDWTVPVREIAARESAVRDMDRIRLADLVDEANRSAVTPIVLGSAELGEQRLSGTFRLDNTGRLARNVADVLGLALTTSPERLLLSRQCSEEARKNCRPPS